MPPTRSGRVKQAKLRPEDVQKNLNAKIQALCQIMATDQEQLDKPINVAEYARLHNVPYQRLNARWNGRSTKSERPVHGYRLNQEQEQALVLYCQQRKLIGLHLPLKMVQEVAEKILLRSLLTGTDDIQLGPH
jgi:hypothetical protein